jgi:hypothetical protein
MPEHWLRAVAASRTPEDRPHAPTSGVATIGPRVQDAVIPDCRHFFGGGYTDLAMVADSQPSTHPRTT